MRTPDLVQKLGLVSTLMLLGVATAAAEGPTTELAAPGPCAEPRETQAYTAPRVSSAATAESESEAPPIPGRPDVPTVDATTHFSIVGPIQDFFSAVSAVDVAAGPATTSDRTAMARPRVEREARPGPCESGSRCGTAPGVTSRNPPIIAGTRPGQAN